MPSFEYNFTDTQLDLISLDEQRIYLFPQSDYDYIKLSVLSADGIFINSFNSNDSEVLTILSENGNKFIYTSNLSADGTASVESKVFVKPNEILESFGFSNDRYQLRFDFLRNVWDDVFTQSEQPLRRIDYNTSDLKLILTEISTTRREVRLILRDNLDVNPYNFQTNSENSLRTALDNAMSNKGASIGNLGMLTTDYGMLNENDVSAINIMLGYNTQTAFENYNAAVADHINDGGILNHEFWVDNYNLIIEGFGGNPPQEYLFLHKNGFLLADINQDGILNDTDAGLLTLWISNGNFETDTSDSFGGNLLPGDLIPDPDGYKFDFVLTKPSSDVSIPIINYRYDDISNPGYTSLVLRLSVALPSSVSTLDTENTLQIEKELIDTQIENIYFYVPDKAGVTGDGLTIDESVTFDNSQDQQLYENYNDLTSSLSDSGIINHILSQSENNLKTDFRRFENHIFFGSARKQLESFKTKVSTIENYLNEISGTLSGSSGEVTINGDSSYVINRRAELFNKIDKEISEFTPYEHFLYFDGQTTTDSGSAPGLGQNFIDTNFTLNNRQLVASQEETITSSFTHRLANKDGFQNVYKVQQEGSAYGDLGGSVEGWMWPFMGKYRFEQPPFFNYSGSVYLSFLVKHGEGTKHYFFGDFPGFVNYSITTEATNFNNYHNIPQAANISSVLVGQTNNPIDTTSGHTGSRWVRKVYVTSASYWGPGDLLGDGEPIDHISNWTDTASGFMYHLLSGSIKTGSKAISTESDFYKNLATVVTESGAPFKGSIMPSGEMFPVAFQTNNSDTSSFITDITITKNNPLNVKPFGQVVSTASAEWTNWYDQLYYTASVYDENNIHSLVNNLPLQYSGSQDLETFVSMMAQQFDLLRMYITNYKSINFRGYDKYNSVPDNLLPIITDTLGWDVISPFTSSLQDYFGNSLNSQDEFRKDSLINSTWRKSLNNLIYIYKSKGTESAINGLLNIYGYPNGVLDVEEGGSLNQTNMSGDAMPTMGSSSFGLPSGLSGLSGNVGFAQRPEILYGFKFKGNSSESFKRRIHTDWWMNDAQPINSVEFIYKHVSSSNASQELLFSSGSGDDGGEGLWDLRVLQQGTASKFGFRLNNSLTGSLAIASNFVSMSTNYKNIKPGELYNVMLSREFNHISGTGIQKYHLYVGQQDGDKIVNYETSSLIVNASGPSDTDFNANMNWHGTGSRTKTAGGNLLIGRTTSGSISQFKTWKYQLSQSVFKQHILNPFSVVGNSFNSTQSDIIYHYKLDENYTSASLGGKIKIIDANPNNIKDYSVTLDDSKLFHSASPYYVSSDVVRNTMQLHLGGGDSTRNSNKITMNSYHKSKGNLSPVRRSLTSNYELSSPAQRNSSKKVHITRSPQRFLNNYIINNFPDMDLIDKIGKTEFLYSSSYAELDNLRNEFFDVHNLSFKINDFVRAQTGIINSEIVESVVAQLPARSEKEVGVVFEPSLFERNKYSHKKLEIESGTPGINNLKPEILITSESIYNPELIYVSIPEDSISFSNTITESMSYEKENIGSILVESASNVYRPTLNYVTIPEDTITFNTITESMSYEKEYFNTINLSSFVTESMSYEKENIGSILLESASNMYRPALNYEKGTLGSLDALSSVTISFTRVVPYSSSISEVNSRYGYINFSIGNENWGRGINDTHFVQAAASGSGNTWHFEERYIFKSVGDVELIDSGEDAKLKHKAKKIKKETDFNNINHFSNRELRDKGQGYTYKSYVKVGNDTDGPQDGRPVGSTAYYSTGSDGELIYPVNHWIKLGRSSDSLTRLFYDGTQNQGGRFLPLIEKEDYSEDAFYRVKVTGDNVLKVTRGKQKKDDNNKLGY